MFFFSLREIIKQNNNKFRLYLKHNLITSKDMLLLWKLSEIKG